VSGKDRSAIFSLVPKALHIHNRGQSPRTTCLNKLQCREVLHIVKNDWLSNLCSTYQHW